MRQRRNGRQRSGSRGGVLVEFAFGALFLVPILMGTFSFGMAIRDYNILQTNVRNAARFASLQDYDSATSEPSAVYDSRIRNLVVYGDPDAQGTKLLPRLTTGNVLINIEMRNNVPYQVTVSIVDYTLVDFFRPISITNKPTSTFPYMGRFVPPV
jgi:Flp pilus assembly protein TadG